MNNYYNGYNDGQYSYRRSNPMATAAVVLGILSIVFSAVFYLALPCAAIAIICAILSRDNRPLSGRGKAGIICGAVGIVVSLALTISAFYVVFTTEDGRNYLQYYYEYYTGDTETDINSVLEDMFPFLGGSSDESEEEDAAEPEEGDDKEEGGAQEEEEEDRTAPQEEQPRGTTPDRSDGEGVQFI